MKGLIIFDFNRTLYNPDEKVLFPGVLEFLKDYSKVYDLAIIGKGDENRRALIEELNIKTYFKHIKIKEAKEKTDFQQCLEEFNATNVWAVGDRIKREITIANSVGIKTVWFKNGKFADELPSSKEEEPKFIVQSFDEIRKIIPL